MWNEWNRWWSGRGTPGERPPQESVRPTSQLENNPETGTESHAVELKIDLNALPDATGTELENADASLGETLPAIEPIPAPPEPAEPREEAAPEFASDFPSTAWDDLGAEVDVDADPDGDGLPALP